MNKIKIAFNFATVSYRNHQSKIENHQSKIKVLPCICPSCQSQLKVKSLQCEKCSTEVSGLYELPVLARLSPDEQRFVLQFVKYSGRLKDMAKYLGLSYPTVRNLLDDIIDKLKKEEDFEIK